MFLTVHSDADGSLTPVGYKIAEYLSTAVDKWIEMNITEL